MANSYWPDQLTKTTAASVPDAEGVNEYNIFIDSADGVAKKKNYLGVVTALAAGSSGSAVSIYPTTAEAGDELVVEDLIGATVYFVQSDGDTLNSPSGYVFDDETGKFTWEEDMIGTEKLNIFYIIAS